MWCHFVLLTQIHTKYSLQYDDDDDDDDDDRGQVERVAIQLVSWE
jgi:hypothetical protein